LYVRAMLGLRRITFLARDNESLQASLFALRALRLSGEYQNWQSISDLLTFLIGPADNLGPPEYLPIAQESFGAELPAANFADPVMLAGVRAQVQALSCPLIH